MASFDITGTLKVKKETQVVSDKFSKREFVVTTDLTTQYPQFISFQLTQDKCSLLDQFNEGDEMKVHFNLRGREWSGPDGIRYFNSLEAWRLEKSNGTNTPQAQAQTSTPASSADVMPTTEVADDLPF